VTSSPAKFLTSPTGQYVSQAISGQSSTGCPLTGKPSSSISSRNLSNRPGSVRPTGGTAPRVSKSNPCPAVQGAKARNSQNISVREARNPSNAPTRNKAIASSICGAPRRQKSDKEINGRSSSIRSSNLSDNPLIMPKGTRILFPSIFSLLPAEH
jgi:hypothetical protein